MAKGDSREDSGKGDGMRKIFLSLILILSFTLFPEFADAGVVSKIRESGYGWLVGILGILVAIYGFFDFIEWKVRLKNGEIAFFSDPPQDQMEGIPSFDSKENAGIGQ